MNKNFNSIQYDSGGGGGGSSSSSTRKECKKNPHKH
jgi:hypothetical protein